MERRVAARLRTSGLGLDALTARVAARLRDVPRFADLGCGAGELLARRPGIGLDCSGAALRGGGSGPRVRGDVENLPFADGRLDVATLLLVLHYLESPGRALAEAARVLRPGGRLIVADRLASPEIPEAVERLRNPGLRRLFRPGELEEAVETAGLRLWDVEPLEESVPLDAWLAGTEPRFDLELRSALPDRVRLELRVVEARKP